MTQTAEAPIKYIAKFDPKFEQQSNGLFAVRNVPIFECHDDRGWNCDAEWMRETVNQQFEDKRGRQFLPRVIEGHTTNEEDKPARGSLDNFRFVEADGMLFADILDIPKDLKERMEAGELPGRSVEVFPSQNRISALALLGGQKPFFPLPDMKFNNDEQDKPMHYQFQYAHTEDKNDQNRKAGEAPQMFAHEDDQTWLKDFILGVMKSMRQNNADDQHKDDYQMSDENTNEDTGQETDDDAGVTRERYADLETKMNSLQTANESQAAELLELREKSQRAEWTQKYADLRVPETILNKKDQVDAIMQLPQEHRDLYFDNTSKIAAPPSTKPTEVADEGTTESGAIDQGGLEKFYDDNIEKYRGDMHAASKAYAKQQRAKGDPLYTR